MRLSGDPGSVETAYSAGLLISLYGLQKLALCGRSDPSVFWHVQ
jgi:hypothetical protein